MMLQRLFDAMSHMKTVCRSAICWDYPIQIEVVKTDDPTVWSEWLYLSNPTGWHRQMPYKIVLVFFEDQKYRRYLAGAIKRCTGCLICPVKVTCQVFQTGINRNGDDAVEAQALHPQPGLTSRHLL